MERRKERRKKPGTTYQKVVEAAVQLLGDRQGEPYRQGGECYNFTFIFFFRGISWVEFAPGKRTDYEN